MTRPVFVVAACLMALAVVSAVAPLEDSQYEFLFTRFIVQHNKVYQSAEFFSRYRTFRQNLDTVRAHNQAGHSWSLEMNQFGDMSAEELKTGRGVSAVAATANNGITLDLSNVPMAYELDWVSKGAVPAVMNTGGCGNSWAISAGQAISGANQIASGSLLPVSVQQLVDCSGAFGNRGCGGGFMTKAFDYVISNKGITSEMNYPYTSGNSSTCKTANTKKSVVSLSSYVNVATANETALMQALQLGPVSVAMSAASTNFQMYKGGVINGDSCGTNVDEAALLVGYGTDAATGLDYWRIQWIWGTSWGEEGYVRVVRGKNQCGIAQMASYPIISMF